MNALCREMMDDNGGLRRRREHAIYLRDRCLADIQYPRTHWMTQMGNKATELLGTTLSLEAIARVHTQKKVREWIDEIQTPSLTASRASSPAPAPSHGTQTASAQSTVAPSSSVSNVAHQAQARLNASQRQANAQGDRVPSLYGYVGACPAHHRTPSNPAFRGNPKASTSSQPGNSLQAAANNPEPGRPRQEVAREAPRAEGNTLASGPRSPTATPVQHERITHRPNTTPRATSIPAPRPAHVQNAPSRPQGQDVPSGGIGAPRVPPPSTGEFVTGPYTAEEDAVLADRLLAGETNPEIARRLNRSSSSLWSHTNTVVFDKTRREAKKRMGIVDDE